jgi:hypothetical protein
MPSPRTPKPAAKASRNPQQTPTLAAEEITERQAKLAAYEREAAKLGALKLTWFAGLDGDDLFVVLALVDLLAFGEHDECLEAAPNWVAAFLSDILMGVALGGPARVNNDPHCVKLAFDKAVDNLRTVLELRRKIAAIPDSALDYINSPEWQARPAPARL